MAGEHQAQEPVHAATGAHQGDGRQVEAGELQTRQVEVPADEGLVVHLNLACIHLADAVIDAAERTQTPAVDQEQLVQKALALHSIDASTANLA